jgi:hypothetical protein
MAEGSAKWTRVRAVRRVATEPRPPEPASAQGTRGGSSPAAASNDDDANGTDPKSGGGAAKPGAAEPPPKPPALTDAHAAAKDRLRKLSTWIIATFGAIATVMVAGSQLSDLGGLDDTVNASLFGWHQTRFEFAVVGLAVMLGATAFAIALAVWVQFCSHVNPRMLCGYPTAVKPYQWFVWRVQAKVRVGVEGDLEGRGVHTETVDGKEVTRVERVMDRWRDARLEERTQHEANRVLAARLADLRTPEPSATATSGPPTPALDWSNGDALAARADALAAAPATRALDATALARLETLERQAAQRLQGAEAESSDRYALVWRVLSDAAYLKMRLSFRMVLKYLVLAGVVAGGGIAMFAWASHPPKQLDRTPAVLVVPVGAAANAREYLGPDCDASTLKVTPVGDGTVVLSAASRTAGTTCRLHAP